MLLDNSLYRKYRDKLLLLIDIGAVFVAYFFATWIKNDFSLEQFTRLFFKQRIGVIVFIAAVYIVCFFIFGIYKSLWKFVSVDEVLRLTLVNVVATIVIIITTGIFLKRSTLISTEIIGGIFALMLMAGIRISYRLMRRFETGRIHGKRGKRVVIVGAGGAGHILIKELEQNENLNYKIIGLVDDNKKGIRLGGYNILGGIDDLPFLKEKYRLEGVLIAISKISQARKRIIYDQCLRCGLETKVMNLDMANGADSKNLVSDIRAEDLLGRGEIHLEQAEISRYITDKVVAVTGAGGSIGSELCRQIVKYQPKKLVMIDISENYLYMLEQEFNRDSSHGRMSGKIEIKSIIASIREKRAIDDIFDEYRPDVVYHAAAHKHVPLMETRPMEAIKNNVFGTNNVIKSCIEYKVKRFIMISTDKAVNPTNVMGASKRMTEMILQANGKNGVTKMAAVRFGNVLGSNGSVIPIFKEQIAEGGPVTITSKKIIRYFMTISEAAQLVLQAGAYAEKGDIFVLDMGEPVKILDLAERMIQMAGLKPYEDIEIKEIGLRPGEKMFEELRLDGENTTKTKNNLIYKNSPMEVNPEEVEEKLRILRETIDVPDVSSEKIKEVILGLIDKDSSDGE